MGSRIDLTVLGDSPAERGLRQARATAALLQTRYKSMGPGLDHDEYRAAYRRYEEALLDVKTAEEALVAERARMRNR